MEKVKEKKKSKNAEERAQQSIRIATKHFISNQFVHLVWRDLSSVALDCCVHYNRFKNKTLWLNSIYTTHRHTHLYWKMFNLMKEVRCGENVECNETTVQRQNADIHTRVYTLNVQMNSWGASFIYVIVVRIRNMAAYAFQFDMLWNIR